MAVKAAPSWAPSANDIWTANAFGERLSATTAQLIIDGLAERVEHFAPAAPDSVKVASVYLLTNSQSLDKLRYRSTAADILRLSGAAALLAPWRELSVITTAEEDSP